MQLSLIFGVLLIAGIFLWGWISILYPLMSYDILLFFVVLLYSRLSIGLTKNIAGLQNLTSGGFISVSDLLWIEFIVLFSPTIFRVYKPRLNRLPVILIGIFLYGMLTIIMPFLSVLPGMSSIYILSAIHPIEWISFALLAYVFNRQYGLANVLHSFVVVVLSASILHFAYSILQFMAFISILPKSFLFLDQIYENLHKVNTLSYSRCTGLFVNPNSYGIFSALTTILAIAIIVFGTNRHLRLLGFFSFLTSIVGVLLSGSRAGFLSFIVALVVVLMVMTLLPNLLVIKRHVKAVFFVVIATIFMFVFINTISPYYSEFLFGRFYKILIVARGNISSVANAASRLNMWHNIWIEYLSKYPLGTWAPPSYIFHSAIDSYYIASLAQGTPIFTFFFVTFLSSTFWLGIRLLRKGKNQLRMLGITSVGFCVIFGIASISMSPTLQPFLIMPFWFIIGLGIAKRNETV